MHYARFRAITMVFLVCLSGSLRAQLAGRLSGSITDAAGAAVPGAAVELFLAGGASPVLAGTATAEGLYLFTSVRPDFYDLSVKAPGFAPFLLRRVKVDPALETAAPPIRLQVEALEQRVEVTLVAEPVQTASYAITSTLTQQQVRSLPVLDRQVSNLFRTQAGVTQGRGTTVINGLRSTYASLTLDGINVQDNYIRTSGLDYIPSRFTIEQVAEFSVTSSNANASIGGGAAQIVQATPSGSNQYHGAVYWYNRNSAAAANTWFRNRDRVDRPALNQNQAGASFGGPVRKDRLVFYANYEAYRLRQQTLRNRTILTPEAREGLFRYRAGGDIRQANLLALRGFSIDPLIGALLAQLPAGGNNPRLGDGLNTTGLSFNGRNNTDRNAVTGKLDYFASPRHTFSATYLRNTDAIDRGDLANDFQVAPPVQNDVANTLVSLSWRSAPRATLTNELRGGFLRATVPFQITTGFPSFLASGLAFSNPVNTYQGNGRNTNTYSVQDNASWVKGRHSVAFGFQGQWIRIRSYNDTNRVPTYSLGISAANTTGLTPADLPGVGAQDLAAANTLYVTLAGIVNGYTQAFNVTGRASGYVGGATNAQNYRNDLYAGYAQDNWRLLSRLTLNLGVRYEYYQPVDEGDGLHLQPRLIDGNYIGTLLSRHTLDFAGRAVGRPFYGPDRNNFAPNAGFAWDVFGKGGTVVRGGYSIAFVNEELFATINSLASNAGLSTTVQDVRLNGRLSSPPPIPVPVFRVPRTIADNYAQSVNNIGGSIDPNLRAPYVQQFNLGVQQEIGGGVMEVRFVGNHGTKLYRVIDHNQVMVRENGFVEDFLRARSNGFLSQAAGGGFNPAYNPAVGGSRPLLLFPQLPQGGLLTNATVIANILRGEAGTLAQFYQTNRVNGPINFFPNPDAIQLRGLTNYSNSTYHSLQAEFRKRTRGGLQLQGNYVFSKVLSDSAGVTDRFEEFLDIRNAAIERARAPFDLTHVFKANGYYELPVGRGKRFSGGRLERLIGGWALSGILVWQSGTPFSMLAPRGTLNRAARSASNTATTLLSGSELERNVVGLYFTGNGPYFINPAALASDGRGVGADGAAAFSGQAFFNPEPGTLGALQRRMFSGPSFLGLDASVLKNIRLTERHNLEFRAEAFNLPNHASFVASTDGANADINSATFGRIATTQTGARAVQFGLYYRF